MDERTFDAAQTREMARALTAEARQRRVGAMTRRLAPARRASAPRRTVRQALAECLRGVPRAELVEDAIGAVLLVIIVLGLPRALAVAAVLLEGRR